MFQASSYNACMGACHHINELNLNKVALLSVFRMHYTKTRNTRIVPLVHCSNSVLFFLNNIIIIFT